MSAQSEQYALEWRNQLAMQHFDHALTKIRSTINETLSKLRALQRPGVKFSLRIQGCITLLNSVDAFVEKVRKERP